MYLHIYCFRVFRVRVKNKLYTIMLSHGQRKSRCYFTISLLFKQDVPLTLIVLGFKDTSTLVGHFVSSPREREKRDRKDCRWKREQGRKRNRNEREETEEIKAFALHPYQLEGEQALPNCKPISVGRLGDARYMTPSHHPTTPCATDITVNCVILSISVCTVWRK